MLQLFQRRTAAPGDRTARADSASARFATSATGSTLTFVAFSPAIASALR